MLGMEGRLSYVPVQKIELQDFRELDVTGPMQDDCVSLASAQGSSWQIALEGLN